MEEVTDFLHSQEVKYGIGNRTDVLEKFRQTTEAMCIEDDISITKIEDHFMAEVNSIQSMMLKFQTLLDEPMEVLFNHEHYKRFQRIICNCFMTRSMMLSMLNVCFVRGSQYDPSSGPLSTEWSKWYKSNCIPHVPRLIFQQFDRSTLTTYQQLLAVMYDELQLRGYKKLGDKCVRMRTNEDGYPTHYWEEAGSIKEFVFGECSMQFQFENWRNATIGDNVNKCINALTHNIEPRFPEVERSRYILSFKNGIYDTLADHFMPYPVDLQGGAAACAYHNQMFPEEDSDIDTSPLDAILDYQSFDDDVKEWFYALCIGRMLYAVNESDNWQVMPFLLGAAQSGKSTILNYIVGKIYEEHDIGCLSNNHERQFGIHPLIDKYVIIAPEVDSDMKLDQTEWQCMISGESISCAQKHGTPSKVEWRVPLAMAGNTQPNYNDNSGSYTRRAVLFDFKKSVTEANTFLKYELYAVIGSIILQGNRKYKQMVEKVGKRNIWKQLPTYFLELQKQLQEDQNSLVSFLRSGCVVYGSGRAVQKSEFIQAYKDYCKIHLKGYAKWDATTNKAVLAQHTIYESQGRTTDCVTGVEIFGRYFGNCALSVGKQESPGDELLN